ncbi:hypothetical protein M422DRAFT_779576 [Sphaerobolus stellatus SS14]|uniref:Uncharacterized protein n=1 Tax=Sphaerobolus stellatus (strain SS14) TaxID=990650 RepID=A0A0C9VPK4_SPHS4|nr:hypothetical protein M422DRAFT_779576 [Sphaerobolus stellatus SS14]
MHSLWKRSTVGANKDISQPLRPTSNKLGHTPSSTIVSLISSWSPLPALSPMKGVRRCNHPVSLSSRCFVLCVCFPVVLAVENVNNLLSCGFITLYLKPSLKSQQHKNYARERIPFSEFPR